MANAILTPTMITREGARILHQECNAITNMNTQYDDQYAQEGGKIGYTLNIRMPAKYNVRTGATLSADDHTERSTPLTVQSQYGVDVNFTTAELTMELDDFSERVLTPAMAQLAARTEGDTLKVLYKKVANYTNATTDGVLNYRRFQQNGKNITNELGPKAQRAACLSPDSVVEFNDAVKGLFQDSGRISKQYIEGMMGRTGGFDIFENTLMPSHTAGTLAGSPVTDGAALGTGTTTANTWVSQTTIQVDTATAGSTLLAGDIITIGGVFEAHPELKDSTGRLRRFVVQADVTLTTLANAYPVVVKPGLIWGSGNAFQNVVIPGGTTDGLAVTLVGAAGESFKNDLFFHKDAFVFATADLIDVSKFGAWGARATQDGIRLRIARQYDITNDKVPCRMDILWGTAELYPELASRHTYETDLV